MSTVAVALTVTLALAFTGSGLGKLLLAGNVAGELRRLRLGDSQIRGIGVLELAAVAGLLLGLAVTPLGVTAALGLVLLALGALVTHLRHGDGPDKFAPALILLLLSALTALLLATAR